MPILRVLASASVLLCSFSALAQTEAFSSLVQEQKPQAAATEPWKILPKQAVIGQSGASQDFFNLRDQKSPAWTLNSESPTAMVFPPVIFPASPLVQPQGNVCYSLRSYVVARDDKDSDATHPTGYSTCQKASRYHLKQAEIRDDR